MPYPEKIHFTPRITNCDWDLLKSGCIGNETYILKRGREVWLEDKIALLCMETIIPLLSHYSTGPRPCEKIMPQFHLRTKKIEEKYSVELLKEFARLKSKTVADIIQIYIIDKLLLEQEKKIIPVTA